LADSGILVAVPRKLTCALFLLFVAAARTHSARAQSTEIPATPGQSAPQTSTQVPQQTPPPAVPPTTPPQKSLAVVVLDPAHGGADQGARGSAGIVESDVVLSFARLLRISLEAQGFRVILTRQANEDPSFDDRSKIVNAQRGAIFITLHVSSTGPAGTVRVYSLPPSAGPPMKTGSNPPRSGLIPWNRAQDGFLDLSRKLAELIQIQMAQRFHGSPETPATAGVRQLRTVAAPAVAIEVSSVSLPARAPLDRIAPLLADGVARAVAAFSLVYETGAK
jgi:N-acetylmuramoyl-L-alanine amidase